MKKNPRSDERMTDRLDRIEAILERQAEAQARSAAQHDREILEIRQLQDSNARSIEALTNRVSDVGRQVAEVSAGVDAAFRTIESMHRMTESLELSQIEMQRQQEEDRQRHEEARLRHEAQMERLGRTFDLLVMRYPNPPEE
jgi:hypothetical protein